MSLINLNNDQFACHLSSITDLPYGYARRPNTVVWITVLVDKLASSTSNELANIFEFDATWSSFKGNYLCRYLVLEYSRSIVQRSEYVDGVLRSC
jgi:hypothetical protein